MGEAKMNSLDLGATKTLIGARSCRSCEYRLATQGKLFCRRYPPQNIGGLVPDSQGRPITMFMSSYPETNPVFPCGEYRRNEVFASEEIAAAGQGMTPQ